MSKAKIVLCDDLADVMPPEYHELVEDATYSKEDRGWKDIGSSKELIEQHSLCAGCPESIAFRYIMASIPAPEDTVFVGSTGCTSLVFPHVAVHNIHSLFGNQNAIASGLKRTLKKRFPDVEKDVIVLAGDGATVDIGLDMTMQSWFRQEKFTTICFDNELYANTGGQESGLMQQGFVALNSNDVVFGPAEDGGYYLIGMSTFHSFIFENKVWSTPELLKSTLQELNDKERSVELLKTLNDVDTIEDLKTSTISKRFSHFFPIVT